jgi:hypothetical protein
MADEQNDRPCDKCGQSMSLLTTLPAMGMLPSQRFYVCKPCHVAISDAESSGNDH